MRSIRLIFSCVLLLVLMTLVMPALSSAQVATAIPPSLPVYEQPACVGPGYIWTPGYWAWADDDYYWVPGTWILAPVGLLWTPGYWAWSDGVFIWNAGYWGPQVGFYGGVVYGYGYVGVGYQGGYWNNGALYYNRAVNNITNVTTIHTVYEKTVVNNVTVNNVSYNGGAGGTTARPTAAEQAAARQPQTPPTDAQIQHQRAASANRGLFASQNHGKPPIAATPKPAQLSGLGVVPAREAAPYHPTPSAARGTRPDRTAPNEIVTPAQPPPPANPPPTASKPNPNETPKPVPPPPKPRPKPAQPSTPPSEPSKKPEPPPQEKQKEQEKAKEKEKPKPPQPPQPLQN